MAPKYKDKDGGVVLTFNGQWVSWSHTVVAYTAFISALIVGVSLHYHKIVENEFYRYPDEWFPSVSATIGDRYPERSFFMIFIAITSGPRFALVGLWYLLTRKPGTKLPGFVATMGVLRTLTCGGWTYITSTDDHDWHDILMISYIVATLPWTTGCIALSPNNPTAIKYRKYLASAFFGTLVPLIYFFIQHKVHRVAGAYTIYAFFEWALILFDVGFDAVTALDFKTFEIVVRDVQGSSKGDNQSVPSAVLEKEKEQATAGVFALRFTWTEALDTAADIYHGFVFWSMLTSLGLLVWYFPLWHMGISGYEAFVMSTISPFLLCISPLRSLVVNNLRIVHLLSLSGVGAYLVLDPVYRLFTVGFAVAMSCLGWVGTLSSESIHEARFESKVLGLLIGLILSSTAKFAWTTNNPIWPIMHAANGGWNGTGLALGVLAALRFTRRAPLSSGSAPYKMPGSVFLSACGVGGLFFALHSLLSDTSTMILWVWEGFPVRGPYFSTHGWFTLAAMSVGVFIGISRPNLAGSWLTFGAGSLGALFLTLYSHWAGYYGGLALTVYIMAAAVPLLSAASKKSPAATFGLGFLIYNFMVLFHVWVVAYAFVPGGPLVREHTDWVMLSMMLLVGAGVLNFNSSKPKQAAPRRSSPSQHRKYNMVSTLVVNILFMCAAFMRFPTNDYKPYHAEDRVLTAGIWTIHFSLDNDMWSSEYRMRDLIKELELDVVGLLESDLQRIIMGNRDTTQFLAEDLGMYVDYGPGPNKHTWGAALLSKFPIVESKHHLLPSPVGELAPAIHATLDVYGELVDVFVFHSGQEEDPEDRRLQSEYLAKLMGSTPRPAILLSYLVTNPLQGNYNTYVSETSGMHDVDPTDWDRWCEYILFKRLKRVGYARVSRSTITDTELQVAKFVIPQSESEIRQIEAIPEDERNRRAEESAVPAGWRFPAMFRGNGVRDHRYHVFDEPRYYN
ncbi:calcofluor white hypersensitive protein [Cordyceps fumosorosea ARSEF 2679]|uniref:Calcofluor white hypersensitive protein n=1 Tax=Cordyceps fumosorosea (strain ARSEF 2679) TaxID=1081104 RepID=A0A167NXS6_CORFA|nr:calcofluor white hypersensitive protein [Cordyceps fumosorosea ARSEF 2679]OAA56063.1 calcofluor white hypersensitive protein [Cordyceps fumosorosea ARSEF 2679]